MKRFKLLFLVLTLCSVSLLHGEEQHNCSQFQYLEKEVAFFEKFKNYAAPYEYILFSSANSLSEAQQIINCLNYKSCSSTRYDYNTNSGKDELKFTIRLKTEMTQSVYESFIKECYIKKDSNFIEIRKIMDIYNYKTIDLPDKTSVHKTNPTIVTVPKDIVQFLSRVDQKLKQNKIDEAINLSLKYFNLSTEDYKIQHSKKIDPNVCVTDHGNKTVDIGSNFIKDSCTLFVAIRHEVEHIKQMKHAMACLKEGDFSAFYNHDYREMSAYLNDVSFLKKVCPKRQDLIEQSAINFEIIYNRFSGKL